MNYKEIKATIKQDPTNYMGYYELGKYLEQTNKHQAYLSYENALYHCTNESDKAEIQNKINLLIERGYKVEPTSIVILSYNLKDITKQCIESIRETTPVSAREIVVVDNNSKDDSVQYLREQQDIILIENDYNAGFPGGCNIGINASNPKNDIFLLNNDTILCENSLYTLRMGLYAKENYGSAGCVTSNCINNQSIFRSENIDEMLEFGKKNNIIKEHMYEPKIVLVGFAVLIKRKVLNRIDLLDEIYFPGNKEDEDLSLRILKENYQNILVHNSYIIHLGGQSFDKTNRNQTLFENSKKFNRKFDFIQDAYFLIYTDSHELFYENHIKDLSNSCDILEIDCNMGVRIPYLKYKYPKHNFYGIDKSIHTALYSSHIDTVNIDYYSNIEYNPFIYKKFDIITLDTTKITKPNIQSYLKVIKNMLKQNGKIIIKADNLNFYQNWYSILTNNVIPNSLKQKDQIYAHDIQEILEQENLHIEQCYLLYQIPQEELRNKIETIAKVTNKDNLLIQYYVYEIVK